jgi:hypothetical protein
MFEQEQKEFKEKGYTVIKNFISEDLGLFLHNYLRVEHQIRKTVSPNQNSSDEQVPDSLIVLYHSPMLETLFLQSLPKLEKATQLKLIPTYCYARLYQNGCVLDKHKDRPSCEVSVTIKLHETTEYKWPLWVEGSEYIMQNGDALVYRGCDLEHWREPCVSSPDHLLGQLFMHTVDANGPHTEHAYDKIDQRQQVLSALI